jgi:hypothetical protein
MFNSNQAFLLVQKLKSAPRALYTRSQGWNRKNLFNLPQVTNKCYNLGPFSSKCLLVTWGQTTSQKCAKLAPSFFSPDSQHFPISHHPCVSLTCIHGMCDIIRMSSLVVSLHSSHLFQNFLPLAYDLKRVTLIYMRKKEFM